VTRPRQWSCSRLVFGGRRRAFGLVRCCLGLSSAVVLVLVVGSGVGGVASSLAIMDSFVEAG